MNNVDTRLFKKCASGLVATLILAFHIPSAYAMDLNSAGEGVFPAAQSLGIASVSPAPNSVNVKWTGSVDVTFTNAIDPTTLSKTSFIITTSSGIPVLVDTITYDEQSRTASFIPYVPFHPDSVYNARVTTLIADTSGGHLDADFTWSFTTAAVSLEGLHVAANHIMDDQGNVIVFRGVNIPDPAEMYLFYTSHCNAEYFQAMADWNVKLIRIPVPCNAFYYFENHYGSGSFLRLLDWAVAWAAERGMYTVIDFHAVGYPPTGEWEPTQWDSTSIFGALYQFTTEQLENYWAIISSHFANDKRIAFYDLFNEPAKDLPNGLTATQEAWDGWRMLAESLIDSIRSRDPKRVIMVGGLDFAYDLSIVASDTVRRPNVVYSTHVYPSSLSQWFKPWDAAFGTLAASYPVLVGEVGFNTSDPSNTATYGTPETFGIPLIDNYLEPKGIGWLAWNFAPVWPPSLLTDWSYNSLTVSGSFFRERLLANSAPFSPMLGSPVDGDTGVSSVACLAWSPSAGAITYRLQVALDHDFSIVTLDSDKITNTACAVGTLAHATTYYWRVCAENAEGTSGWSSVWRFTTAVATGITRYRNLPDAYALYQNFPNPFNPLTTINFDIPRLTRVRLLVYDVLGRLVEILVDGERPPGRYRVTFDGSALPSGVYIYSLIANDFRSIKKMIVLK